MSRNSMIWMANLPSSCSCHSVKYANEALCLECRKSEFLGVVRRAVGKRVVVFNFLGSRLTAKPYYLACLLLVLRVKYTCSLIALTSPCNFYCQYINS
jgi:hypothetical protein